MNTSENIDETTLSTLLQNSSPSLLPDSLIALMTAGVITSIVISILFLVVFIISTVRKWKVQSAMLNMQKDISEIKHYLAPADAHQSQPGPDVTPRSNDVGPNPLIAERYTSKCYTRCMQDGGSTNSITLHKQYRGITDENCLYWCHGTEGLEHRKVRKYRYPLWKYAYASHRVVSCICLNCNMQFYGDLAKDVPLSIPVIRRDSYFSSEIPVKVNGKSPSLRGEIFRPFRHVTQEMLTDQTRLFIELVQ